MADTDFRPGDVVMALDEEICVVVEVYETKNIGWEIKLQSIADHDCFYISKEYIKLIHRG